MNGQVGRLMKSKASDDICTACSLSSSLTPLIWCIDCGDEVEIPIKDTHTCRCPTCNKQHQRDRNVKKNINYRARVREKS